MLGAATVFRHSVGPLTVLLLLGSAATAKMIYDVFFVPARSTAALAVIFVPAGLLLANSIGILLLLACTRVKRGAR